MTSAVIKYRFVISLALAAITGGVGLDLWPFPSKHPLLALVDIQRPAIYAAIAYGYLMLFGVGSTIGMAVLSGLLGWPLARLWHHHWLGRGLSLLVGCASTALGISWAYPMLARIL
jgi:hypothetical protein